MLYVRALHIIFMVTWFAGLFYIVRLFIYHTEAEEEYGKSDQTTADQTKRNVLVNQYKLMQKRLWYGITWPGGILTTIFGFWLLIKMDLWSATYMHVKFTFIFLLILYHLSCQYIYSLLRRDKVKYTANALRVWNEVATLFLVAIVFVVVLKNALNWIYGVLGLVAFAVLLMTAIKLYKKMREKG